MARRPQPTPPEHEEISGRLLAWVGPIVGERVLDVGCGGGRLPGRLVQAQAMSVSGAGTARMP